VVLTDLASGTCCRAFVEASRRKLSGPGAIWRI